MAVEVVGLLPGVGDLYLVFVFVNEKGGFFCDDEKRATGGSRNGDGVSRKKKKKKKRKRNKNQEMISEKGQPFSQHLAT